MNGSDSHITATPLLPVVTQVQACLDDAPIAYRAAARSAATPSGNILSVLRGGEPRLVWICCTAAEVEIGSKAISTAAEVRAIRSGA